MANVQEKTCLGSAFFVNWAALEVSLQIGFLLLGQNRFVIDYPPK